MLSPVLVTLFTHDCVEIHPSNAIVKFADDTTIVGLISENEETAYREEVQHIVQWCEDHNLVLNTKEIIVDFRRSKKTIHSPLHINGEEVERVNDIEYLVVLVH